MYSVFIIFLAFALIVAPVQSSQTLLSNVQAVAFLNLSTPQSQPFRQSSNVNIVRNVGNDFVPPGSSPKKYFAKITSSYPTVPSYFFRTAVEGISFTIKFTLPPSTYDVLLGFVQTIDCQFGARVFNVYINKKPRDSSLDIFQSAGCARALLKRYNRQIVDPKANNGLTISLETVSGLATLSYIRILTSKNPCIPDIPNANSLISKTDHYAHAVPGLYPQGGEKSYVDRQDNGYYKVQIDGSGSHTHFTFKSYTARIKSYEWTRIDTGQIISTAPNFWYTFPLGTIILRLKVTDTVCSVHEDTTSITVTGHLQRGAICYVYDDPGFILRGGSLKAQPRPKLSFVSDSLNFKFPSNLFANRKFGARCIFLVTFKKTSSNTRISLETAASGVAHLYQSGNRILDSNGTSPKTIATTRRQFVAFELVYRYFTLKRTPTLQLKVNNTILTDISYDAATSLPIISSITPNSGSRTGGTQVRISGYNLYRPLHVYFGDTKAVLDNRGPLRATELIVTAPPHSGPNLVQVRVRTGDGYISNRVPYSYSDSCDDVKFDNSALRTKAGKNVVLTQVTAMTIGQDGNLYVATVVGRIHKISFDHETHIVLSMCHSEVFRDRRWKNNKGKLAERAFLGITLDPRDTVPRPYVSASTLFYYRRGVPIARSNLRAWSNGAIERFKPATPATRAEDRQQCLEHDKTIVDGLPVSNSDHSVNHIVFTQTGDLLLAVGSNTNMGLPNVKFGSLWDNYFSGAIVLARLSKPGFNGTIPYSTPENLRTARPRLAYNDVELYATGLRNPYAMFMARSGRIYAADMGPNSGFGDAASSCNEYIETEAKKLSIYGNVNGGGAVFGTGKFKYSASRPDKLVQIVKGKFYGHPNLQRSAILNSSECAYIDPISGKTPLPRKSMPPRNYLHRLALVTSPVTGILEYGGNSFCGKLRGDFILSRLKLPVFHLKIQDNGRPLGSTETFNKLGGITAVEDSTGSIIFGSFYSEPSNGFIVFKPQETNVPLLFVRGAVPYRHGKKGGTNLFLSGRGFNVDSVVYVGGKVCRKRNFTSQKIVCIIPPRLTGARLVDVVVTSNGKSSTLSKAVLYMEV